MPLFKNRVLAFLEQVYRFDGGQRNYPDFDLTSPIVRVHDVGEAAGKSAGFVMAVQNTHTIAGASTTDFQATTEAQFFANAAVASRMTALGLDPSAVDVWLLAVVARNTAGAANFSNAAAGISRAFGSEEMVRYDTMGGTTLTAAGPVALLLTATAATLQGITFPQRWYPRLAGNTPTELRSVAVSNAGGGTTIHVIFICAVVPSNCPPPGLP